jgi:hypothetical protein
MVSVLLFSAWGYSLALLDRNIIFIDYPVKHFLIFFDYFFIKYFYAMISGMFSGKKRERIFFAFP